MNRISFRIIAWALIGLHLADALLISGGSWLARYAHSHSLGCISHCCHAEQGRRAVATKPKKTCCGHYHHKHAAHQHVANIIPDNADQSAILLSPTRKSGGPCDECAACRHERQSLQLANAVGFVAVQRLVIAAAPTSHPTPILRVVRGFDSRGPPAVAL